MYKFKKGDKVVVYNAQIYHMPDGNFWGPFEGVVKETCVWGTMPGYLMVETPYGTKVPAHPMQCRKVRKK